MMHLPVGKCPGYTWHIHYGILLSKVYIYILLHVHVLVTNPQHVNSTIGLDPTTEVLDVTVLYSVVSVLISVMYETFATDTCQVAQEFGFIH